MKVRTVLWDNDGVLVDTEGLFFRATREVLSGAGVEITRAMHIEYSLVQGRSLFELVEDPEAKAHLRDARDARYEALIASQDCAIFGALDVLKQLHGKLQMGVVTSSRRRHFDVIHQRTGMAPMFDFVLAREDYERSKPNPEPYLSALSRYGLWADQCVAIEDSRRGLLAAKAAGLCCWVVPNALTRDSSFDEADQVLPNLGAALSLLI